MLIQSNMQVLEMTVSAHGNETSRMATAFDMPEGYNLHNKQRRERHRLGRARSMRLGGAALGVGEWD